jgi:hypothetical protein
MASSTDELQNGSEKPVDKQPDKPPADNTSSQQTSTTVSTFLAPPRPRAQSVIDDSQQAKASGQRTENTTGRGGRSSSVSCDTSQPRKKRSSLPGLTQYASLPAGRRATASATRKVPLQHTQQRTQQRIQQRQKSLIESATRNSRLAHLFASRRRSLLRLAFAPQFNADTSLPTNKAAYNNQATAVTTRKRTPAMASSQFYSGSYDAERDRFLRAYGEHYEGDMSQPFDRGDFLPEYCICHKGDDGGPYIECDNKEVCLTRYYHPYCLGMATHLTPDHTFNWFCHNCIREGRGHAGAFMERIKRQHLANRNVLVIGPGFYRDKYGNILRIDGMIEASRPSNIDTHIANAQAASTQLNVAMSLPSPATVVNPWSADLDKSFMANPQNMIDMDIDTLEGAKESLRARAAQPLGSPQRVSPRVVNGTVVKQPNKNSWTKEEDDKLVEIVKEVDAMGLVGTPLWDEVSIRMKAAGMSRVVGGARNRWMRGLREATQIDERRKKNALKLTTATQRDKGVNNIDTEMRGVKRAYDDDDEDYEDDMDMLPSVPIPTRASLRSPTRQRSSTLSAPRSFAQPDQKVILSSPRRRSRRDAYEVDDYDDALTDVEDLRNDLVRKRLRYK